MKTVHNIPEVRIGKQIWMAENLNVSTFSMGTRIFEAKDNEQWEEAGEKRRPAWCYYANDKTKGEVYGKLYNWYAVSEKRGLAPEGWHLPDEEEWGILITFLGGKEIAGGKLKEAGTAHWHKPNTGATNESGFSCLPGGYRLGDDGVFGLIGDSANFWSATEFNINTAGIWYIDSDYQEIFGGNGYKHSGYSVRCVKNE